MNQFYFGDSDKQLLGTYYPPASPQTDVGVVLCYPLGHEYIKIHKACRQLCIFLAKRGYPVLKFDYFATGDSAGNSDQCTLAQCKIDISTAATELRDISGVRKISLIGVRLGAALAAEACKEGLSIADLVLWDPVVIGADFLHEIGQQHFETLFSPDFSPQPRALSATSGEDELLGFPYTSALRNEIEGIDLLSLPKINSDHIIMVCSKERNIYSRLKDHFIAIGFNPNYRIVSDSYAWENTGELVSALLPVKIIEYISNSLTKNQHD